MTTARFTVASHPLRFSAVRVESSRVRIYVDFGLDRFEKDKGSGAERRLDTRGEKKRKGEKKSRIRGEAARPARPPRALQIRPCLARIHLAGALRRGGGRLAPDPELGFRLLQTQPPDL